MFHTRRNAMVSRTSLFMVLCLACCAAVRPRARVGEGRQGGRGGGRGGQEAAPIQVVTDKVTPDIPGVVKAGTKIEIVATGLRGSDAGIGMSDGSVLVVGNGGVLKFDPDGKMTTLVENAEQAAGLTLDPKGRVIAAQYTKKVSVILPKGSEEVLTDGFDGKKYIRPNDLVAATKGSVYFTDCYQIRATRSPDDLPQAVY